MRCAIILASGVLVAAAFLSGSEADAGGEFPGAAPTPCPTSTPAGDPSNGEASGKWRCDKWLSVSGIFGNAGHGGSKDITRLPVQLDVAYAFSPPLRFYATAGEPLDDAIIASRATALKNVVIQVQHPALWFACALCSNARQQGAKVFTPLSSNDVFTSDLSSTLGDAVLVDPTVVPPLDVGATLLSNSDEDQRPNRPVYGVGFAKTWYKGVGTNDAFFAFATPASEPLALAVAHAVTNHTGPFVNQLAAVNRAQDTVVRLSLNDSVVAKSAKDWEQLAKEDRPSFNTLADYGTQYRADGTTWSLAQGYSIVRNGATCPSSGTPYPRSGTDPCPGDVTAVVGFRQRASEFQPLDVGVDSLIGTHGGVAALTVYPRYFRALRTAELDLTGQRFADGLPRFVSTEAQLKAPLSPAFVLRLDASRGVVATSVAARTAGFYVPDSAGGTTLTPQASTLVQLGVTTKHAVNLRDTYYDLAIGIANSTKANCTQTAPAPFASCTQSHTKQLTYDGYVQKSNSFIAFHSEPSSLLGPLVPVTYAFGGPGTRPGGLTFQDTVNRNVWNVNAGIHLWPSEDARWCNSLVIGAANTVQSPGSVSPDDGITESAYLEFIPRQPGPNGYALLAGASRVLNRMPSKPDAGSPTTLELKLTWGFQPAFASHLIATCVTQNANAPALEKPTTSTSSQIVPR